MPKFSLVFAMALGLPLAAHAEPAMQLLGKGVQIYVCQSTDAGFAWKFKAPDAVLTDAAGNTVGRHFGGPTWQATDGGAVVGEPLVSSPSPKGGAVPWLILHAKSHTGDGIFANVAYIARTQTEGGAAPSRGCDAAHNAAEVRQPYSATYTFFPLPSDAPK